jgi:hypothetical protein
MKKKNSRRLVGFAPLLTTLAGLSMCTITTHALDVSFEPRLETGALYYDFSQENVINLPTETRLTGLTGFSVNSFMPFVGGGISVFLDRFFLDLYAQAAFNGDDSISQNGFDADLTEQLDPVVFLDESNEDDEFDRQEYSASLGYALTPSTALYVGYKRVEFSFDGVGEISDNAGTTNVPWKSNLDYSSDGFFIGGVQAWNVDWKGPFRGALSVNLGVGFLNGTIDSSVQVGTDPVEDLPETTGDSVGLNVGAAWKAPITKKLAYSIGVNGYQYNYDADQENAADFSEALVRFTAGLSYSF